MILIYIIVLATNNVDYLDFPFPLMTSTQIFIANSLTTDIGRYKNAFELVRARQMQLFFP